MNARTVLFGLLAVVAVAAAVLSFAALDELGRLCGFGALSVLLPLVLDAGAAAGTVAWLGSTGRPRSFGRVLALVLLGGSVVGNATAHGLVAYGTAAPWWAVVAVSAVAPAVLGAVVHLATLTAQTRTERPEQAQETPAETPGDEETPDRAAELIAVGVGRLRLARELGISEHQARELLAARRNGNGAGS
ncbi:MAG: hypothetical protein JWR05_3697 [Mucilaginibacter sp.]|nr:hypothetical protein [Mucilaginibacter sp.]